MTLLSKYTTIQCKNCGRKDCVEGLSIDASSNQRAHLKSYRCKGSDREILAKEVVVKGIIELSLCHSNALLP